MQKTSSSIILRIIHEFDKGRSPGYNLKRFVHINFNAK